MTEPATRKFSSLERWLTVFVCLGSALVCLSLCLQSALIFVIGEGVCLFLAPLCLWLERDQIRQWWHTRWKCPVCGRGLQRVNGDCPGGCGNKRFGG